jgi:hypothetical protein
MYQLPTNFTLTTAPNGAIVPQILPRPNFTAAAIRRQQRKATRAAEKLAVARREAKLSGIKMFHLAGEADDSRVVLHAMTDVDMWNNVENAVKLYYMFYKN